ncbi:hypothetical protein K227x_38980 [Rubripirellula lacrimiformis]|uniref:Sulfatase n=1 Tax=Rubripirellula lacrimiformis TaxID=1930273 RepID=A0A517NEL4_9BACT|nr:DUF1501 domain-containing protein [Rubripirellula lacrimiformis]QDT05498.1 hypothetical protein K227x_38980 [Rubripirellula lacrimiformis]
MSDMVNSELLREQSRLEMTRRYFFGSGVKGLGAAALAGLLSGNGLSEAATRAIAPKAKRVIYLFQSGGPTQLDLFDYKPELAKLHGSDVPESVFGGQRLTGMTAGQTRFPVASSAFDFAQCGSSGAWLNKELLPHLANVVNDVCFIRSMHTEAINHDPAITFFQSGFQLAGRPSIGAWMSYGLGSENENLPAFVAMTSNRGGQALYDRLWGAGFLPSKHQGVRFRSGKDPVLYLNNPDGINAGVRRSTLDHIRRLNELHHAEVGDPEIQTRIAQYEMAFRMQTSVPELTDVSGESEHTFRLYGEDARKPGTYAYNVLLARRLSERGVRFVQLFHRGWDTHNGLVKQLRSRCRETDQASAGLITDLKQRGLLDETLVVWGGEFGRTVYCQGELGKATYGRDHHPRCFTMWMAGGGVQGGMTYGETDDYSYNITQNPVSVHDLHATMLHQLGIDHEKLTYKFQGRHYRLTDVHGQVVKDVLA